MALSRSRGGNRFSSTIWPGFVDAMTVLLMVLTFVITIFMIVQSVLRDTVDRQESQLDRLTDQVAGLTGTLAITQDERDTAQAELDSAEAQIVDFESQVAQLIASRDAETARAGTAEQALSAARGEIDAQAEAARLAAARREALEALVRDLEASDQAKAEALAQTRATLAETDAALSETQTALAETRTELSARGEALDEAEAARLAEAAAAEALRARLKNSEAELTAMTLSLEQARQEAEDMLTLLAAADAARADLETQVQETTTEAERQAALLAQARDRLADQEESSTEAQRRVALLNQQVATLNRQLSSIQQALNLTEEDRDATATRLEDLGQQLNAALLKASEEQRRRLALEEAERARLEAETADLARYRSEFFGRLSQILQGREGVEVVGDRFVLQSEVLFDPGEATLSPEGQRSIAGVTEMLQEIADTIPAEIDWVIRVDGHTDRTPLSGLGRYRDNWELSQARALAVVRYMVDELGFAADRLAPTGFSDTRPVAPDDSPENRARNRRIELKLTER